MTHTSPSPVLTPELMEQIRRLLGARLFLRGRSFRDVAKRTGVSIGTISKILDPAGAANRIANPNIEKLSALLKVCRARLEVIDNSYKLVIEQLD